jgi:hypothetical protein
VHSDNNEEVITMNQYSEIHEYMEEKIQDNCYKEKKKNRNVKSVIKQRTTQSYTDLMFKRLNFYF